MVSLRVPENAVSREGISDGFVSNVPELQEKDMRAILSVGSFRAMDWR